eukprot:TRINITY_DN3253_c0_g1_i1.p1 TRINITY_DN3253_c0_g1~~TRINITY_DN3253_c0_g1_i1.p1  ORF type:complete len:656 (-),score=178.03 TRINITY_DN3253_c0_g1_i1:1403-3331(-)
MSMNLDLSKVSKLRHPERPVTPRNSSRKLFAGDYSDRPQSAYVMNQDTYYNDLRPPTARQSVERFEVPPSRMGNRSSDAPPPTARSNSSGFRPNTLEEAMEYLEQCPEEEIKRSLKYLNFNLKQRSHLCYEDRDKIQQLLGRCFDFNNPKLVVNAAKIILQYQLSSSACRNAIKALFKLSRDSKNDVFLNSSTLYSLVISIIEKYLQIKERITDEMVYAGAFLKNSSQDVEQKTLLDCGGVNKITSLMALLAARWPSESLKGDRSIQLAVQLVGTLRNLASIPNSAVYFAEPGVLESLLRLSSLGVSSQELVFSVARIFSKLSLDDRCREAFTTEACLSSLVSCLYEQRFNTEIVVRLAFGLGNLCTFSEDARIILCFDCAGAQSVIDVFATLAISLLEQPQNEVVDAFAKVVRLVANLSINTDAGTMISSTLGIENLPKSLIKLSECEGPKVPEALLNALAATTNLTFYGSPSNRITAQYEELTPTLVSLLAYDNDEIVFESARSLGNLSRIAAVRAILSQHPHCEVIAVLLNHSQVEILEATCGILVNIASDVDFKSCIYESGALKYLFDLVTMHWMVENPALAVVVLKTIFNYLLNNREGVEQHNIEDCRALINKLATSNVQHPEMNMVLQRLSQLINR